MKKLMVFVVLAFVICIPVTSASTSTNWDVSVSNGSLFCDSASKSSIHGESSSSYHMSLHAFDTDSYLSHNLSTDNVSFNSKTVLIAGDSNLNKVLFQEGVRMSSFACEEGNSSVCFSGYSGLASFTSQIETATSSVVDNANVLEHSITSIGSGNFRLDASSYLIAGTVNESFFTESTSSRINIFDADFAVNSSFQDPIDRLPHYVSELHRSLCPFP